MSTAIIKIDRFEPIFGLVLDSLDSPKSRAVYRTALRRFVGWYEGRGRPGLSKALVQGYKRELQGSGLAPRSVNLHLSSIRKLALEAGDNGLLDPNVAAAIGRVPGVKVKGRRLGNWLSVEEAQALLDTPDTSTVKGVRDRAILAVMLGGGLRRAEIASLTVGHLQQRDGRWAIVDLVGKGQRVRSVPIPSWVKDCVDDWLAVSGVEGGPVFRRVLKGDHVSGKSLTDRGVYHIVREYGVACHDLRRTFGNLSYKGGADLRQIQLSLGHSSIRTTEIYLATEQDFVNAPCDRLGLGV